MTDVIDIEQSSEPCKEFVEWPTVPALSGWICDTCKWPKPNHEPSGPRLKHLKTIVQHVFIVDDGESLMEQVTQPVEIQANEWHDYPTGAFARQMEELRNRIESNTNT